MNKYFLIATLTFFMAAQNAAGSCADTATVDFSINTLSNSSMPIPPKFPVNTKFSVGYSLNINNTNTGCAIGFGSWVTVKIITTNQLQKTPDFACLQLGGITIPFSITNVKCFGFIYGVKSNKDIIMTGSASLPWNDGTNQTVSPKNMLSVTITP